MSSYDFKTIEERWRRTWREDNVYKTNITPSHGKKMYVLDMFPYPSGEGLHVGHPKGYIATDIYSRMKKMSGYEVLHPMGWDAFGLPAEQYALKNKVHPRAAVEKNIARFKEQLDLIGFNYDWSQEINTTDPEFYRWTQWIFKQMFKKGLAHESHEPINWCPSCMTGLSNEDLEGGKCERCGSEVEKKPIRQWVLKIKEYADRMLEDLDELNWPQAIKESQRHWIGKSVGVQFSFALSGIPETVEVEHAVDIFTTRPDTLYGATFVAISADVAADWIARGWITSSEVFAAVNRIREAHKDVTYDTNKEKDGVFTGVYARNPATGARIPVWVANYVVGGVGTGAIMAVPAHDERDADFAQTYGLPVVQVVQPHVVDHVNVPRPDKPTKTRRNVHVIVRNKKDNTYLILRNSIHSWDTIVIGGVEEGETLEAAARRELREETGYTDVTLIRELGAPVMAEYFAPHKDENRRAVSSALYFELESDTKEAVTKGGENEGNQVMWVSEKDFVPGVMINSELALWLERMKTGVDTYTGPGTMINSGSHSDISSEDAAARITEAFGGVPTKRYKLQDWVFARQRYWGEPFPIVFDSQHTPYTVADSELPVKLPEVEKYEPTGTGESPLAGISEWVNVYGYINDDGDFVSCDKDDIKAQLFTRETNTMPQWAGSSWYYLRFIDPKNTKALVAPELDKLWSPVDFYVGGAEHATRHLIYARFWHKFLYDIGVVSHKEPFTRLQNVGLIQAEDGRKMSKRYGNVVNPDDVVAKYGADTLRVYEMFMGPFDQSVAWSTSSSQGSYNFLERVWNLSQRVAGNTDPTETLHALHRTIKKVGEDIELFKFNTAISQMMTCCNVFEKQEHISEASYASFIQVLAPFAPHMTEELWHNLGRDASVHTSVWPIYTEEYLIDSEVTIAIQIGGKLRGTVIVPRDMAEEALMNKVREEDCYHKYVGQNEPRKVIVIPNKIVNIVI